MAFELVKFFYREVPGSRVRIMSASLISGLARGMILTTINAGAAAVMANRFAWEHLIAFVLFVLLFGAANYYALSRARMMVEEMTKGLRMRISDKLLFTHLRFVESQGIGEIYARLTTDVTQVARAAIKFLNAVQNIVVVLFCLGYIGWLSPLALGCTIVAIIVGLVVYLAQDRRAVGKVRAARAKEAEFFTGIKDILDGYKEIKLNRARHMAVREGIDEVSADFRDLNVGAEILYIRGFMTSQLFLFGLMGMLIFVLPQLVPEVGGAVFPFLAAILFLVGPMENLVTAMPRLSKARVSLRKVRELEAALDAEVASDEDRSRRIAPLGFETLTLDGIGFEFVEEGSDDSFDLGPVDLEIRRGEVMFIVGGNGSGKTTLLKVLTALYTPTAGRILIDGRPVEAADRQAYREMFSAIYNDFHLFRRLYGMTDPDLGQLDRLLSLLQLSRKTRYEGEAFSTVSLSTGQRKRLAYAVAALEDRNIYVLDEFAADQDPGFRRFFYNELLPELKAQGKTIIAVTHDDAYFHACDRLIKMDYGRIVQESDYQDCLMPALVARDGNVIDGSGDDGEMEEIENRRREEQ